jgi:4-amino-4-deoxy-L-arabinose transferase-like glycosyltransferase
MTAVLSLLIRPLSFVFRRFAWTCGLMHSLISDTFYSLLSFGKRQMNNGQQPATNRQIVWFLLALAAIFIYFFGLNIPLLGPDEPRYAQVAREMLKRGDWITPTLGGVRWLEKPALLYWLEIAAYKIFGVTELAARFGSALFGLGTIFSLWILGKQSAISRQPSATETKDEGQTTKDDFANWLALIAASSIGLLAFARGASFDIILTFPVTASLVSFFIFEQSKSKSFAARRLPLVAFYFFIGVALLAKGLIGIIFPLAIVGFYYLLSFKFPDKTFIVSLFWGMIVSLSIASLWYLPMYRAHGWAFIDEFFVQHHFQRYISNKYLHPQPFWFFWLILPLLTIPWLPFFLASIWTLIKKTIQHGDTENTEQNKTLSTPDSRLTTFALAWLLVPLVFFSFSGSKLPGYILPALPAALILTADYVTRFVRKSKRREIALQILAFLMFVFVFAVLEFFIHTAARHETVKTLIVTADSQGFADAKILTLHNISQNAEFYAEGRLQRLPNGKQRYLYGVAEVREFIEQHGNQPVLVLVPLKYLNELTASDLVTAKVLSDNGKLAIAIVSNKEIKPDGL